MPPLPVDKDNSVRNFILAVFAIAAATQPALAQDTRLFGTSGPLQDELLFDPAQARPC
jgi:hypothetical protein